MRGLIWLASWTLMAGASWSTRFLIVMSTLQPTLNLPRSGLYTYALWGDILLKVPTPMEPVGERTENDGKVNQV